MNSAISIFESNHKKLGLISFDSSSLDLVNGETFRHYIKVLLIPAGYALTVDFTAYETQNPTLLFINTNQYLDIQSANENKAFLIIHYKEKHSVADYADLLNLAPKTLSNKFHKLNLENPNEMIKNRIVLEAKRLLLYSELTIKEIAYQLGYEDPAYFNRIFTQKSGKTPAAFRKEIKNYITKGKKYNLYRLFAFYFDCLYDIPLS